MACTVVGKTGRLYVQGEALQRHGGGAAPSVFKATAGNESFVMKRAPKPFYNLSHRLAVDLTGSSRLRIHVDYNSDQSVLVYPFYRDTFLGLMGKDINFPVCERIKVLRSVAEAVKELHEKDWVHLDIKPDNILINWNHDREGDISVDKVALGDFDIAFKSEAGKARQTPYAVGNAMWRSPEGQTGRAMTKASDVFSLGLVFLYALGAGELLLLENFQKLAQRGIPPEQEIDDQDWRVRLQEASQVAERALKDQPELRFEHWGKDLGSEAQNMISGMTRPDPTARTTISQVLASAWWHEA